MKSLYFILGFTLLLVAAAPEDPHHTTRREAMVGTGFFPLGEEEIHLFMGFRSINSGEIFSY